VIFIGESREPLFAAAQERRPGGIIIYFDRDGFPACTNVVARPNYRACVLCHNCCISFVVDDKGEYLCSACGKFDRKDVLVA
jgi:hypothetical protein